MVTTEHDPRAWRVATALAHATGLDWARWAKGDTSTVRVCGTCAEPMIESGTCGRRLGRKSCGGRSRMSAPQPVPAPWDTEAYLADCRRRGVEPGPLPALEYRGDGVWWALFVRHSGAVSLQVEAGGVYVTVVDGVLAEFGDLPDGASLDGLVRATNLARVAAEAMR